MSNYLKIVQIVVTPDNSTYQGRLIGLGNDGVVYFADNDNTWHEYFPNRFTTVKDEVQSNG